MSDFMEMFCEMLPAHSELQKTDNEFRKVLDKTIGAFMDENDDIYDELFLSSASKGWLDCFGRDYGVTRRIDEDDESYRQRIIFEKLEYLTANNLKSIYNLTLYAFIQNYNIPNNQLTSDNEYISTKYMSYASNDLQKILNNKFVLGDDIKWL